MSHQKALFIPLKTKFFEAFERGEKQAEMRLYGKRWNERNCRPGRPVTLSCGYGKHRRLYGRISDFAVKTGQELRSDEKVSVLDVFGRLDVEIAYISIDLNSSK